MDTVNVTMRLLLMSIDNLYFIRTPRRRISTETKCRPICIVSSLFRPFLYSSERRSGNTRLRANTRASSFYSLPPFLPDRDFRPLLSNLITSPETCFLVVTQKEANEEIMVQITVKIFESRISSSAWRYFRDNIISILEKGKETQYFSLCRGVCSN